MGWETGGDAYLVENNGLDLAYCWDSHSSRVITIRPAFLQNQPCCSCLWSFWTPELTTRLFETPRTHSRVTNLFEESDCYLYSTEPEIDQILAFWRAVTLEHLVEAQIRAGHERSQVGLMKKIFSGFWQCHLRLKWANQWWARSLGPPDIDILPLVFISY